MKISIGPNSTYPILLIMNKEFVYIDTIAYNVYLLTSL